MSLVLSGGYEDDVDNGDEFTYTGSGGRELKGEKGLNHDPLPFSVVQGIF